MFNQLKEISLSTFLYRTWLLDWSLHPVVSGLANILLIPVLTGPWRRTNLGDFLRRSSHCFQANCVTAALLVCWQRDKHDPLIDTRSVTDHGHIEQRWCSMWTNAESHKSSSDMTQLGGDWESFNMTCWSTTSVFKATVGHAKWADEAVIKITCVNLYENDTKNNCKQRWASPCTCASPPGRTAEPVCLLSKASKKPWTLRSLNMSSLNFKHF